MVMSYFIMDRDNIEPSIRKNDFILIDKSQNRVESSGIYALNVNGRVVRRRYNIREDALAIPSGTIGSYRAKGRPRRGWKTCRFWGRLLKLGRISESK